MTSIPFKFIDKRRMSPWELEEYEREEEMFREADRRARREKTRQERADSPRREIVIGVDVARFGTDSTAICVCNGQQVVELQTYNREHTMQTTGRVAAAIRKYQPYEVRIDEIGIGAGVLDRLRELKFRNIFGVNVSKRAVDHNMYANLRAEMFDTLRKRFEEGTISIPDDQELIEQLSSLRYTYTSAGQIQLESKESMSSRGLRSPDKADALALALGYKRPWTGMW